jgi:hypothetical protein
MGQVMDQVGQANSPEDQLVTRVFWIIMFSVAAFVAGVLILIR